MLDGETLFEASLAHQIDNMEGLALWTDAVGATRVSMISDMDRPEQIFANMDLFSDWKAFTLPDLWIGAVVGIAFIVAAIWMRRSRELAD